MLAQLGGYAALMLKCVLRFWTPRHRASLNHIKKRPKIYAFDTLE